MKPYIDLNRFAYTRKHGDIRVFGTWVGEEDRPALVMVPANRPIHSVIPCVIPADNAWLWSEEAGEPEHVAQSCYQFAEHLGINPYNRISLLRIFSIVRDEMGELLSIPPKPTEEARVAADLFFTDEKGKTQHIEVIEHA